MTGYVYFVLCHDRVKIGFSLDPVARLVKINADAPYRCELLGYVRAEDYPERDLHEMFGAYRVHGEWFLAVPRITDFIEDVSVTRAPRVAQALPVIDRGDSAEAVSGETDDPEIDVRALRRRLRENQFTFAARFGVDQGTVSNWETKKTRPSGPARKMMASLMQGAAA